SHSRVHTRGRHAIGESAILFQGDARPLVFHRRKGTVVGRNAIDVGRYCAGSPGVLGRWARRSGPRADETISGKRLVTELVVKILVGPQFWIDGVAWTRGI